MIKDPQAFPSFERLEMLRSSELGQEVKETLWVDGRGMSLRDYFAAKAMQAWLSTFLESRHPADNGGAQALSEKSYALADAMLEARKK